MASHMFLPPVADTLLLQFKKLAKSRVETASPQVHNMPDHCDFLSNTVAGVQFSNVPRGGKRTRDARLCHVVQRCCRTAETLLTTWCMTKCLVVSTWWLAMQLCRCWMLYWHGAKKLRVKLREQVRSLLCSGRRQASPFPYQSIEVCAASCSLSNQRLNILSDDDFTFPTRNASRLAVPKLCLLQLAVETVFLEAANQLVAPGSSGLSGRQSEALERLAFDWALNAETYVEPKFSELVKARERVRLLTAPLLAPVCAI